MTRSVTSMSLFITGRDKNPMDQPLLLYTFLFTPGPDTLVSISTPCPSFTTTLVETSVFQTPEFFPKHLFLDSLRKNLLFWITRTTSPSTPFRFTELDRTK